MVKINHVREQKTRSIEPELVEKVEELAEWVVAQIRQADERMLSDNELSVIGDLERQQARYNAEALLAWCRR